MHPLGLPIGQEGRVTCIIHEEPILKLETLRCCVVCGEAGHKRNIYLTMNKIFRVSLFLLVSFLFLRAVYDFYLLPADKVWSENYRLYWNIGLVGLCVLFVLLVTFIILAWFYPNLFDKIKKPIIKLREHLGLFRWPLALLVLLLPLYMFFFRTSGLILDSYLDSYALRIFIALLVSFLMAMLFTQSDIELVRIDLYIVSMLIYGGCFVIAYYLTLVTSYPFSLSWSEGNRFYDYSVILGGDRYQYQGKLTIPYDAPGRYLLWGILFLIKDAPIWLHRLWNAILWTALPILFGYLIARLNRLDKFIKLGFTLWIFLFLYQGPIYPPLILSAILVVFMVSKKHMVLSLAGVALAGYYASSSRWTWFPAPAIWAVLILVSELEIEPMGGWKNTVRKLLPVALVGGVGLAVGYLAKADFLSPQELASMSTLDQPLLWYRLFPNATCSFGIMQGVLLASGPVVAWMIWAVISGWWRINWIQGVVYAIAGLATLVVGLVISVKIGGGNNLHNLDMYLVTLVFLVGLMLKGQSEIPWKTWPGFVQVLVGMVLILPVVGSIRIGSPLRPPLPSRVAAALKVVQDEVYKAKSEGEILFMDQRQLITFGYIKDLPLVSDYEKKYMMDMAMANNSAYFDSFYADLAKKRFKLIISDPLKVPQKAQNESFGDESNSWVKWVAQPVLCYYRPIATFKDIKVQLLVPRANPDNCP
jgi:hypothetical protein